MKTIAVVTPSLKWWNDWLQSIREKYESIFVYSDGTAKIDGDFYYMCNDLNKVRGQRDLNDYILHGPIGTIKNVEVLIETLELKIKETK